MKRFAVADEAKLLPRKRFVLPAGLLQHGNKMAQQDCPGLMISASKEVELE